MERGRDERERNWIKMERGREGGEKQGIRVLFWRDRVMDRERERHREDGERTVNSKRGREIKTERGQRV